MIVTLNLTDHEVLELRNKLMSPDLAAKVERAIQRAESFIDDNDDEPEMMPVDCRSCDGKGNLLHKNRKTLVAHMTCFTCGGSGKEWV